MSRSRRRSHHPGRWARPSQLAYSGTAPAHSGFAQIVDARRPRARQRGHADPGPARRRAAHDHAAARAARRRCDRRSRSCTLQLIGGSQVYGPVRGAAALQRLQGARRAPDRRRRPARPRRPAAALLPTARTCMSRRRFVIHLRGRLRKKAHARLRRRQAREGPRPPREAARDRGPARRARSSAVKVADRRRSGAAAKVVRETRRYRTLRYSPLVAARATASAPARLTASASSAPSCIHRPSRTSARASCGWREVHGVVRGVTSGGLSALDVAPVRVDQRHAEGLLVLHVAGRRIRRTAPPA